jgi:hypothetical protein
MRLAALFVLPLAAPALAASVTALTLTSTPDDPKPKKGDTVVVRGCLGGGVLETLDVVTKDGKARAVAALTFRLTGDKKLLKTIKEEHTNHSDSITGVLKTDLPETGKSFGTTIGNTSVGIGMVNPHGATDRPLPVLEVKEFEHTGVTCR